MRLPDAVAQELKAASPAGWEVVVIRSPTVSAGDGTDVVSAETLDAIKAAEAYYGFGVPGALVAAAPMLRWAHSASAGVGSSITPELRASNVVLTNSAGIYAEPMADTVLAGVLHFLRGLDYAVHQQHEAKWDQTPFVTQLAVMREVRDCGVLVVGAGGIGSTVAVRFQALGSQCIGIRRRPELGTPPGFARVAGPQALHAELRNADVVVLSAPLTVESRQLLSAEELALLPSGAIVVNVARGALLDEGALLSALDSGRLRGAVLDVFAREPLPPEHALWRHPRVLITPHVSGVSPNHWGRALSLFLDNWRRYVTGEPLRNVVDLDAGY